MILSTTPTRPRQISDEPKGLWVDYYYDQSAAYRAVKFIERELRHSEGEHAGQPFQLLWWQKRLVLKLFGWKRRSDGMRKHRFVVLHIPKKNGKTALDAAISNYAAFADKEPSAHVALLAADKEQAGEAFKAIANQVIASPKLVSMANVYKRSIFIPRSLSSIRVLSKAPGGKHGPNWQMVVVDEGHAIENKETVDNVTAGIIARRQPIIFYSSTAGIDETHWYYELYQYAKRIASDPSIAPEWLVAIYEADPDKWEDEAEWIKANPSIGHIITIEALRREFILAKQLPTHEAKFKRLYLNIWSAVDIQAIPMERWAMCVRENIPEEMLRGRACYVALDLAATTDFASAALIFPPFKACDADGNVLLETDHYEIIMKYWFPESNVQLRKKKLGGFDITPWVKSGHITLTDGEVIDYDNIENTIVAWDSSYDIREIAFDPWNSSQLVAKLDGRGYTMVKMRQGFATMSDPTKSFLGLILQQKCNTRDNPVLTWNARNLRTEQDPAGNIKPSKRRSKEKIDGIVAVIMGIGRALVNAPVVSIYESQDIKVIG